MTHTINGNYSADILIVDDTLANLQFLAVLLKEEGYKVRPANSGKLALQAITQKKPDLILLDIKMPEMDGYQVCETLKNNPQTKDIPIIFISALSDVSDKVRAFYVGGVDYITKPFQLEEVKARVATHLQLRDYQENLAAKITEGIEEIKQLNQEIIDTQHEVIVMLGAICEGKSFETAQHIKRVSAYSQLLARHCHLSTTDVDLITQASPMHDLGKIAIPDAILEKQGRFTPEEWDVMKNHATLGYQMLCSSTRPLFKAAATIALEHHEKWDGSGYPQGLKGDEIHIFGRITAVADVFDALSSKRCYKNSWELENILTLFEEQKGLHFDPMLVDILFTHLDEFLNIRSQFSAAESPLPVLPNSP
ncbi:MAG: two-component system response regulator [Methylococcales bacterium]|nr:two-component system response regulator [Methylococcales bacterium]